MVVLALSATSILLPEPILYRVLVLLLACCCGWLCGFQTVKGRAFFVLAERGAYEIRKVVWPTRQETTQTTLIVVAVVLVMALLLWGLDSLLGLLVSLIVG